jgi:hypothetical protein
VVNSTDQNTFPGSLPTPANAGNFRYDVNADGTITFLGDRQIVVANTGHTASCP